MIIKVEAHIYAEVDDREQGESLCQSLTLGLERRIGALPEGEMVGVDVERFTEPNRAELEEAGMVE